MARSFAGPPGVFRIDDVSVPKPGRHPVGVQRQYSEALGATATCRVAVSVHDASPEGHDPLDLRLDLPEGWLADAGRLDKAGAPDGERRPWTKPQTAPELLDRVRAEGLPGSVVVADAGYGVSGDFRDGLAARERHYVVGVTADLVVFPDRPTWVAPQPATGGRPQARYRLADGRPCRSAGWPGG